LYGILPLPLGAFPSIQDVPKVDSAPNAQASLGILQKIEV